MAMAWQSTLLLVGGLAAVSAQTSNYAVMCTTTVAVGNYAAGSPCAVPFRISNDTDAELYFEPISTGSGYACPVVVTQDIRYGNETDFAIAQCHAYYCVTKATNNTRIEAGTPCVFPFKEREIERRSCITDSQYGEEPWCATTVDENGDYEYKQWGLCDCYSANGPTPPAPTPPPPTPPPAAPNPNPSPPVHPPPPPRDFAPDTSDGGGSAIASGVGGAAAALFVIAIMFVAYRRGAFAGLQSDARRDLGFPKGFNYSILGRTKSSLDESESLMRSSAKKLPFKKQKYGTGADPSIFTQFDSENDVFSASSSLVPQPIAHKPRVAKMVLDSVKPASSIRDTSANIATSAKKSPKSKSESAPAGVNVVEDEIDWAAMEAAAAKLRTCRINKSPGEKIGMRLLNYLGPNFAGVKVVGIHPGSPAAKSGIVEGDSIVEIANSPVINLYHQEVIELLGSAGNSFDIIVCRD